MCPIWVRNFLFSCASAKPSGARLEEDIERNSIARWAERVCGESGPRLYARDNTCAQSNHVLKSDLQPRVFTLQVWAACRTGFNACDFLISLREKPVRLETMENW